MFAFARRAQLALVMIVSFFAFTGLPRLAIGPMAAAPAAGPVVFAAASMQTALDAIAASFTAKTGTRPSIVYGSSAVLARQIEHDAPADIFISADLNWMDVLDKAQLIRPGTRRNFLGNALVLIAPADSTTDLPIKSGFDLAGATGDGRIAVCTLGSCPAGIYAQQALESLRVWEAVQPKLAQANDVRGALTLVSRGEARFGVVYATDAKADPGVRVLGVFPESTHSPIVYPVAILASSKNSDATTFVAFLGSQAATRILLDQGFTILSK